MMKAHEIKKAVVVRKDGSQYEINPSANIDKRISMVLFCTRLKKNNPDVDHVHYMDMAWIGHTGHCDCTKKYFDKKHNR